MPRRRPDHVHEFRISFSDFERDKINRLETAAIANVGLDAVTDTLKAAGAALGGAGGLLAAYVLLKWKAPEIIADITNVTNGALDAVVDTFLPGTPIEFRREAQRLAAERGAIAKDEAAYCSFSASTYDEARCSSTQERKDKYYDDRRRLNKMLRDAYKGKAYYGVASFVYAGLGDIDPAWTE
jgi:hypothetical protein